MSKILLAAVAAFTALVLGGDVAFAKGHKAPRHAALVHAAQSVETKYRWFTRTWVYEGVTHEGMAIDGRGERKGDAFPCIVPGESKATCAADYENWVASEESRTSAERAERAQMYADIKTANERQAIRDAQDAADAAKRAVSKWWQIGSGKKCVRGADVPRWEAISPAQEIEVSLDQWGKAIYYVKADDGDEVTLGGGGVLKYFFRTEAACNARIHHDAAEAQKKRDAEAAKATAEAHKLDKYR